MTQEVSSKSVSSRQPAIYLSHGGGPLPYLNSLKPNFRPGFIVNSFYTLKDLIKTHKPKCLCIISAHYEENIVTLLKNKSPKLYYDYYNFPKESYNLKYNLKTNMKYANKVESIFKKNNIKYNVNTNRGWDHGVFIPLMFALPNKDIDIIQVSLYRNLNPELHLQLGSALSELRDDGVLLVGSGSSFHGNSRGENMVYKANKFDNWLIETLNSTKLDSKQKWDLFNNWKKESPYGIYSHPREEHLLPLHVILGSCYKNKKNLKDNKLNVKSYHSNKNYGIQYSTHVFY